MLTYEQNVKAILECIFEGFKDELIENACKRICTLNDSEKPKTGHWKRVIDKIGRWEWECDKCYWQQRFYTNFCPDCGAKMESEDTVG